MTTDQTRPEPIAQDNPIGEVDVTSESKIAGWIGPELGEHETLELEIAGIRIRSQRAEHRDPEEPSRKRFKFMIGNNLYEKLPSNGKIKVRILDRDQELPFAAGISDVYAGKADDGGTELRARLSGKWHIDHWGNMHVSFGKDPSLLGRCARIYSAGRHLIRSTLDTELYLTGGNLLGIVREGQFLDHDDDIDASFILKAETPEDAAELFFSAVEKLAPVAKESGLRLKIAHPLHLYVIAPKLPYLDVLVGWLTSTGYWCRPSGYGGDLGVTAFKYKEINYANTTMAIPEHAERELVLTYGEGWDRKDEHYSKVRPTVPLRQIQKLQTKYKERVLKENNRLDEFFKEDS